MASPLRPNGLQSEFIDDIVMEGDTVKPRTMDPVGELKQRLYQQPQNAANQLGDDLAKQSMLRNQAASRAASQARYAPAAPAPAPAAPTAAARAGGVVQGAASKLRSFAGAASPRAVAGKVLGAAGKIAAPIAAGAGVMDSFNDTQQYQDSFTPAVSSNDRLRQAGLSGRQVFGDNAVGNAIGGFEDAVNPILDSTMSNGLRVMGNVGNALTGGIAEKVGNVLTGGSFSDPTARQRSQPGGGGGQFGSAPTDAAAQASAGTTPGVFDNAALAARGMNVTPEQVDPGRDPNSIQSILRGMLTQGNGARGGPQGAVIGDPANDPFEKLKREVIDAHGGGRVAKGTLAKKLMQIEEMRQGRQVSDQQNQSTLRGQDQQAFSDAQRQKLGVANTLADFDVQSQAAQGSKLRAQADMAKLQSEIGEKGFERFNKLTDGLFQTTDADGKPTSDTQKAERFRSYIMGTDPKNGGGVELFSLAPQEQAAAIQNLRTQFEIQEERNASGGGFGATTQNTLDAPVATRDAALSDVFGRGLSAKDYVYSNLPFTDNEVVQTQSGQSRLRSDYVGDDADRLRELQKYTR